MKTLGKAKIRHDDGSLVTAKFWQYSDGTIRGEYKFEKMTYGITISTDEAISKGLIK
jgi:hypothetical protein